jgi:hypothetical protein
MSNNYQQWLDGEIGDSELNRLQAQSIRAKKLHEMSKQEQALMREIYGFDNGVAYERERIIKLLDTLRCKANGVEHDCNNDLAGYSVDGLIALIKGENK